MARSKLPGVNGSCSASARSDRVSTQAAPALRPGAERGRAADPGDLMPTGRQFEGEEAGAATGVERVERPFAREDEIEDAVPSGAFGGRADAMAEVLVEVRCPSIPMGSDLLLDDIGSAQGHTTG